MNLAELVTSLELLGVHLWEQSGDLHFKAPRGVITDERRAVLRHHKQELIEYLRRDRSLPEIVARPEEACAPFPLTDMQSAYVLGRDASFLSGGVACHAYGEVAYPELDAPRLERAWNALIRRHDMLRAVIHPHGYQYVLRHVPEYRIKIAERRGASSEREFDEAVRTARAELDHQVLAPDSWPLFDLRLTISDRRTVLHVSIDLLIADYVSIQLLLRELHELYHDPQAALPDAGITFRDYLLAQRQLQEGRRYQRDRQYWLDRIDGFPSRPDLPIAGSATDAPPVFRRHQTRLAPRDWAALQDRARENGMTPSGVVLGAYAEAVAAWSRQPTFTLNITLLNRPPLHSQVMQIVGDFTSVNLLAVETDVARPFLDRTRSLQARLWEDLDHRLFSGVAMIREIARRRGADAALMPIVFTSAIGLNDAATAAPSGHEQGELVYAISQTPQVWIDCQVMERQGALDVSWDVRDGIFPPGLIEDMFEAYAELLRRLCTEKAVWDQAAPVRLPAEQRARRRRFNGTAAPLPDSLLHERLLTHALATPDRPAVISSHHVLSYGDVLRHAVRSAELLREQGCSQGDIVGVVMDKGAEQVVGVLAALIAGAAYLPVDMNQPAARRSRMLRDSSVACVMTQTWLARTLEWPTNTKIIPVDLSAAAPDCAQPLECRTRPEDLAYVIYTSGSTGSPKGVMISHRAAVNTIDDINSRFSITGGDAVLAVASLGFDLSVYDIFGLLAAGGSIVLPDADRRNDPSHWAQLIAEHQITVWNTVPAQFQMLVDYAPLARPATALRPLRLAMLSGDWVPLGLVDKARRILPHVGLISLGGATEAAIWSIVHPIGEVAKGMRSVPYGTPLRNQTFHVLDSALRPCPDWVAGDLYIGGAGLAAGYLGDETRTAERFIRDPHTGERLYHTGDVGRHLPNGEIEFLGRADRQIKINGNRIELSEIEEALLSYPSVAGAAVVVHGNGPNDCKLGAFVESAHNGGTDTSLDEGEPPILVEAKAAANRVTSAADCDRIVDFALQLDRTALLAMLQALRQSGLFQTEQSRHSVQDIFSRTGVAPRHERLIRRWLNALEHHALLRRHASGEYSRSVEIDSEQVANAWREAEALRAAVEPRTELLDYFRVASQHLPELMRGELDPLELLFPHGRTEIHEVAYHDSFLGGYLNAIAVAAVSHIAKRGSGPRPLEILEIGAGVAGTSVDLIRALDGRAARYLFTDVSPFFLNRARALFEPCPWVSYALFDLNKDFRAQGLAANSFDVVVCANVLHYATDARVALGRIREMLKPGGWLVFIEMVRDNYQVLTSMEFLFDSTVTEFQDARHGRDATFLSLQQWDDILECSGAVARLCLPEPDDMLSRIGFHVFAAQFKADRQSIDTAALAAHVASRLPDYMRPASIEVLDAMPLTANGKVDRTVLASWCAGRAASRGTRQHGQPITDLERRLAGLWASVLGVAAVGRDEGYFELGGDSLLAAQLVGRMHEEIPEAARLPFDSLLRLVLDGSTVAAFAARFENAESAEAEAATHDSPLINLGPLSAAPSCVLVHDGSGTLASYRALLDTEFGAQPLSGLAVANSLAHLDLAPAVLIERMATLYAGALRDSQHEPLTLAGYDVGGLIAAEVARQLLQAGVKVRSLTVIGSAPLRYLIEDDLLVEYLFARGAGLDPVRLGFPAETGLGRAIALALRETSDRIPDGRLASVAGDSELEAVAWCFRRLAAQTRTERLGRIAEAVAHTATPADALGQFVALFDVFCHTLRASALYKGGPYAGDITVLCPKEANPFRSPHEIAGFWSEVCLGELQVVEVPGDSFNCMQPPNAAALSQILSVICGRQAASTTLSA
jgi:pyochelin synthetase